jgi:hypothetical protein
MPGVVVGTSAATNARSRLSTSTGNRSTIRAASACSAWCSAERTIRSIRPATGDSIRLQRVGPMHGEDLLRPTGLAIEQALNRPAPMDQRRSPAEQHSNPHPRGALVSA